MNWRFTILFAGLLPVAMAVAAPQSVSGKHLLTGETTQVAGGKQGLVVVFLSARCPCSNSHVKELKVLAKDFPDVHFVAVHSNRDEDQNLSQSYFRKSDLPFPVLQDSGSTLADQYKALKTPHAFFFNSADERLYAGGVSDSHDFANASRKFLREALEDHSQGKPVRSAEGRTLSCIIQR